MNKTMLGALVGAGLGLLDGLSAWMSPDARPMMTTIVIGSTVKGLLTGAAAGLVARRWPSRWPVLGTALIVAFVLSALAAGQQPGHYWEIVLPGMLVGLLTGFAVCRYPRASESSRGPRGAAMILFGLTLAIQVIPASTQTTKPADPLSALEPLVGRWESTSEGVPGKGTGEREYSRVIRGRFIQGRNRVEYPPQNKNPRGDTHEDIGLFSVDQARKLIVLRQFHGEGFVNQYVSESASGAGALVFTTEAIENIPPGWRARETYRILGPDEIEEVFELAEPGKDFTMYSRTRLRRIK